MGRARHMCEWSEAITPLDDLNPDCLVRSTAQVQNDVRGGVLESGRPCFDFGLARQKTLLTISRSIPKELRRFI